jgi:hypothetical protein
MSIGLQDAFGQMLSALYVIISNRIFLCSILNLTPFELRFRHKPTISHLRPFGCKCFVLKHGNLDKFESRSSDGILLCTVYTVHKKMRSAGFLVWPQNQGRQFVTGLASKPLGRVSRFGPQNRQLRFGDLDIKITMTVSWVGPQNHVGYGLSIVPQNQREDEDGAGHVSRSSGLLHL